MKNLGVGFIAFLLLLLGGCATLPELGGSHQEIPLSQIDLAMQKKLPLTRKASFGSVKIVGTALQSSMDGKGMEIPVKFILTSYEIPEGIEGLITYRGSLRYAPDTRTLYLGNLEPLRLEFSNPSLREYISPAARKGIATVVASSLKSLPLLTMPQSFRAQQLTKATVLKEKLLVDFQ